MNGLIMDYQLTLPAILRRADMLFGGQEIVTRQPDKSFHRYTYADFVRRTKQLALALRARGIGPGDRVATLCWNQYQHLEAYFGIPALGGVLHTLNLRLPPDDLVYIMTHAEDRALLIDETLLPVLEKVRDRLRLEHIVVISQSGEAPAGTVGYEQLLDEADEQTFAYPDIDEHEAAAMCYTSGTTGRPKGVLYSHRAIALHSMAVAMADVLGIRETDVVMPVVPMFHANAWGLPFASTLVGAKQVFPGRFLDAVSLLDCLEREQVTIAAGVPTIWFGIQAALDKEPDRWRLTPGLRMAVGGAAVPQSMIEGFDRHGLQVIHAWGMTEMSPVGSVSHVSSQMKGASATDQAAVRAKQGRQVPFIEARVRGAEALAPWDGETMGELEVRGPWVASAYYNIPDATERMTEDGWFRTGDIVTIDPLGYIELRDRTKDLVKSGGEWISSVALENALMGHPAVAEAAVIAVPHPTYQERPLAVVVAREGQAPTPAELRAYLAARFVDWWLPDAFEFVPQIPHTATGKMLKTALRDQFRDYALPESE